MNFDARADSIHNGPAWHAKSTKELLKDVTAAMAVHRPSPQLHTIAELVAHMIAWRDWALRMLSGDIGYRIQLNSEADWPTVETLSDEEWSTMLATLDSQHSALKAAVASMTEQELNAHVGDRPFTFRVIADGVFDHDIYHGGQIACVLKMITPVG